MTSKTRTVLATIFITATFSLPAIAASATLGRGQALSNGSTSDLSRSAESKAITQEVSRGIAIALNSRIIRSQVRDALRNSPWNEHRLVLQEFAATPQGHSLVASASRTLGLSPREFKATINSLSQLDFYAPFLEHRTTWKATSNVLVAAVFERHAPQITAYDTTGNPSTLLLADGVPASPLLILTPAKKKHNRSDYTRQRDLIEDPKTSAAPAKLEVCDTSCDGGGGGTSPSTGPGYYLTYFDIKGDDGWFGGTLEMLFSSYYEDSAGNSYQKKSVGINGVNGDQGYTVNVLLNSYPSFVTPYPYYFTVEVWESDGGLNGPNDFYGYHRYTVQTANGSTVTYTLDGRTPTAYLGVTAR